MAPRPRLPQRPTELTPATLRLARERLGLTQLALSEALGVHPNTIARWERSERPIPSYLALAMRDLAAS